MIHPLLPFTLYNSPFSSLSGELRIEDTGKMVGK
jgi:hypothetical protein